MDAQVILSWDAPYGPIPANFEEDFEEGSIPENWTLTTNSSQGWFITQDGSSAFWSIPSHSWYMCSCPCHKRFKPYYDKMSNAFLSSNQVLQCTSSKKPYFSPQAFKAHLHDTNDWIHKLLHIFVTELYEVKPNEYIHGPIKPIPNNESEYKSQKSVNNIPVSCHKTKG